MLMNTHVNNRTNGDQQAQANAITSVVNVKETSFDGIRFLSPREQYLNQYTQFAVKTAQSTVEMCRVVFEAKHGLKKNEFVTFCADIGHKSEDSTIRKYLAIGGAYDRLIQHTNLLPNSWTSIYLITQLPSDVFDALALTGNSMASMNGNQIKALIDSSKKAAEQSPQTNCNASTSTDETPSDADACSASNEQTAASTETPKANDVTPCSPSMPTSPSKAAEASDEVSSTMTASNASAAIGADMNEGADETSDQAHATPANPTTSTYASDAAESTDDGELEPYDIVIHFNSRPIDAAAHELVESIWRIKSKYRLDIEITSDSKTYA